MDFPRVIEGGFRFEQGTFSLGLLAVRRALESGAAAYELRCPTYVNAESPSVVSVPEGWVAKSRNKTLRVEGIGLVLGPPEELGDLKPEPFLLDGKERDGWGELNTPIDNELGLWLICRYSGEYVVLTKKIDRPVEACWIDKDARTGPRAYTVYCKPAESSSDTGTGQ